MIHAGQRPLHEWVGLKVRRLLRAAGDKCLDRRLYQRPTGHRGQAGEVQGLGARQLGVACAAPLLHSRDPGLAIKTKLSIADGGSEGVNGFHGERRPKGEVRAQESRRGFQVLDRRDHAAQGIGQVCVVDGGNSSTQSLGEEVEIVLLQLLERGVHLGTDSVVATGQGDQRRARPDLLARRYGCGGVRVNPRQFG